MALTKVRATRFLRRTRGGSRAILCEASDGNFYVCKSPVNPQSRDVLGSEYIYTRFGEMIGAQVQPQAAVDFGEDIIEQALAGVEGSYDANVLKSAYQPSSVEGEENVGPYYGSLCPVDPITTEVYDFIPRDYAPRLVHPERFGAILALDAWLYQEDSRQIIYWPKGKQIHWAAIDHGYTGFITLADRASEWEWKCPQGIVIPFRPYTEEDPERFFQTIEAAAHKIAAIRPASIASVLESCPKNWKPNEMSSYYTQTLAAITLRKNAAMIIKSAASNIDYGIPYLNKTYYRDCESYQKIPRAKQDKIGIRARKPKAGAGAGAGAATDTGAESVANPRRYRDRYGYGRRNPANTIPGARLVSWLDPEQSEE